jgi:hypothetical protein
VADDGEFRDDDAESTSTTHYVWNGTDYTDPEK